MLNFLKNRFLYRLIRVLDNHYQRAAGTRWWEPNFCEPNIQAALRDLCRPADVVFDVGANIGQLSVLLSRIVGPRGIVCSFEASPRNLAPLQTNVSSNGCGNVRVVHAAVGATSGPLVGFIYGSHPAADHIRSTDDLTPPNAMVPQLALDDFVEHFALEPRIVKMDIENAEYSALLGFRRTLDRLRPIVLMETSTGSRESVTLLRSLNYRLIDLCNYHELQSDTDFPPGVMTSNVLCLPAENVPSNYASPLNVAMFRSLDASQFRRVGLNSFITSTELPVGRYVFEFEFEAMGWNNRFACGLREFGKPVLRFEHSTSYVRESYRFWTWHCHHPSQLEIFLEVLDGTDDPTFKLIRVNISQVANLAQSWMTTV